MNLATGTATTLVTSTKSSSTVVATSSTSANAASAFTSYAKTSGHVFNINGKTEYFMGTNSYWIGFLTNNADVDLVMSHLAAVRFPLCPRNSETDKPPVQTQGSQSLGLQ